MIKIVTDSSLTISPDLIEDYGITVVPLSVMIDNVVYSDKDLKHEGYFRQLMSESESLPKTSQPPVGLFAEVYEGLVNNGAEEIIAIHLTSSLSGTIEASRQGAILANAPVTIIDSEFTDQALTFQVIRAAQLAKNGASKQDIIQAIQETKDNTELYIGVSNLENLVKGGRVSRISGLLGSLLNIHVMMNMESASLTTLSKGRGKKVFKRWFTDFKKEVTQRPVRQIGLSYSGDRSVVTDMFEELSELLTCPITVLETGAIIQTHTGDGAFALMVEYD